MRRRPRDIGKDDSDLVIQRDLIPQSRRADRLPQRGFQR